MKTGARVMAKDPQGGVSLGEYTGYSTITKCHYVSFFNGYTGKFKNVREITPVQDKMDKGFDII